jgi:hypothetical protein
VLAMFQTPGLRAVAEEVEEVIIRIMNEAAK